MDLFIPDHPHVIPIRKTKGGGGRKVLFNCVSARQLQIDENVNRSSQFQKTLSGCDVINNRTAFANSPNKLNIERLDHHCGGDLVN